MVYRITETDEEPLEYLETYQRRMKAFSELGSDALKRAGADSAVSETIEALFLHISLLIREVMRKQFNDIEQSVSTLQLALEILNSASWLTEVAIIKYKANRGYRLTNAVYKYHADGLAALIERLKAGEIE